MTNVTILQNNKMQNIFAVFPARPGGWQTYEMCSILPDCKRWAQFDAFIQYVHYTYHYDTCNICANMTYMLQIHSAITLKKILARRAWSYRRTRTAAVSRLDLLLKVLFDDSRTLAPYLLFLLQFVLVDRFPLWYWSIVSQLQVSRSTEQTPDHT